MLLSDAVFLARAVTGFQIVSLVSNQRFFF